MARSYDRSPASLRPISFQRNFTRVAPGSVLTSFGETRVLCTAVYTDGVPPFLQGRGQGWLTAEYGMLPGSTNQRKSRDRAGKTDGRSVEIQRLIGRSLRAAIDLSRLTERTLWIDCDVLQADGGTRTAAITGAWVALVDLLRHMESKRLLRSWPLLGQLAAVSVGVVGGEVLCDLDYSEDSKADVDMNLVMLGDGQFVEVQGSAEGRTFPRATLDSMLAVGEDAIRRLFEEQSRALEMAVG
ncbi:MAG: ribonuclease PH [Planctomycetaceae bacterium]|nr:ribonuclease PH [Planctomycetaceae bacterium]